MTFLKRRKIFFREVEKMVHPKAKESTNKKGLTPRQVFTRNHENLMEKGEKRTKDTATSCTVVAAFVVTIIFAAAFTIPGRDDNKNGLPISKKTEPVDFFMICDGLSLCFSTVSVSMFLGILTSRYSEDDFLEKLPRQMIIGLISLFCAITTMLAVFLIVILIELHTRLCTVYAFGCLAFAIATLFIVVIFRLLVGMIRSTYGRGIFDRN
ncbi:uncharacterized protein LOC122295086 isoform X2 [Carya illinoinensis]|uniref:PGG domain-containing protein n=1 Tax=Carya illinoinensis TaxID=32201 RepID=A0A8T1NKK3_CARIL|nr:uncharacterized protein LOC122295086 isoform X2 [Carya illinoinensis]KAG6629433.1 hypothetical protein CIPAW_14G084200 [Carya illinoinensis]